MEKIIPTPTHLQRLHCYPEKSEVQYKSGHVRVKGSDGKWHPRGRVRAAKLLGEELSENQKVFHKNGNPSDDSDENLAVITFSGTRYRIARSRPVYIPPNTQQNGFRRT